MWVWVACEWEAFEFGVFVFGVDGSGKALFVRVVVYVYVKAGDREIGVFFIQSEHVFGVDLIFILFEVWALEFE